VWGRGAERSYILGKGEFSEPFCMRSESTFILENPWDLIEPFRALAGQEVIFRVVSETFSLV
jgi:hypothetical protein